MTHEIMNALAQRRRSLPTRDGSRYQTLKLVIQRTSKHTAVVSLMFTNVGGHRLSDTRLAMAHIMTVHPDGSDLTPQEVLREALDAIALSGS